MQPAVTNLPTAVNVNLSTQNGWKETRTEHASLRLDAPDAPVRAHDTRHDPLWDGPYAQPARPGDWRGEVQANATPRLEAATGALRDAVLGVDLLAMERFDSSLNGRAYGTVHLTFAERPVGLDHLKPFESHAGSWTIGLRTSLDDLFADPRLAPVVDATREVIAAAREAAPGAAR